MFVSHQVFLDSNSLLTPSFLLKKANPLVCKINKRNTLSKKLCCNNLLQKHDRLLCRFSSLDRHHSLLTPVFQLVRGFQAKNMIRRIFFSMCKKKKQETGKFEGEGDGNESGYQKKYFFEVPVQPFLFSVCVFNYVTFGLSEPFSGGPN